MAKIHKTARGQMIDMDKLKLSNEKVTSVGNMRTNARGDVLGVGNQIATGRNAVMDQVYAVPNAPVEGYSPKPLVAPIEAPVQPVSTTESVAPVVPTAKTTKK